MVSNACHRWCNPRVYWDLVQVRWPDLDVSVTVLPSRSIRQAETIPLGRAISQEIAEAVAKLPPDQLARFRRWFAPFEAGRSNHELDSTASKLGRIAGRALAELNKREKEP
jgi:hypothetical protein